MLWENAHLHMTNETLACIPNISEGRDLAQLKALRTHLQSIPDLQVRQLHSDPDHHRSVITMIGPRTAIHSGVLALFEWANQHIDLRQHQGVHPRLGAVDVVPFVPLAGITLKKCLRFANELATEVASSFKLPVYLYEKSTLVEGRSNLAEIRRGEFEGLFTKIKQPEWQPDFGPVEPHPSMGATVMGVRNILIAFNAWLETPDVVVARRIARRLRERDGGMPGLKTLGLYLPQANQAQVAMNIVDWPKVPLVELLERLNEEVTLAGTALTGYELVGLAPREWLLAWSLANLNLTRQQVLDWP